MSTNHNRRPGRLSRRPRAAASRPLVESLEARTLLTTLIVNTNADFDLATQPGATTLSLREAIEISNGTLAASSLTTSARAQVVGSSSYPAPNLVEFDMPGSTVISPASALPTISQPLYINGNSQANDPVQVSDNAISEDFNDPLVRIDGGSIPVVAGQTVDGLDVTAQNTSVIALIVTGFSGNGVAITGASAHGDGVYGSFIGTLPDPGVDHGLSFGNASTGNGLAGVKVTASNDSIGDDQNALFNPNDTDQFETRRNVIANNQYGVDLETTSGVGTLVENNLILDDTKQGVLIRSSNNTIGDSNGGVNFISGSGDQGVLIDGSADAPAGTIAQGNLVIGDAVGVDGSNKGAGVDIENSSGNTIGGDGTGARNLIAGNTGDGITINDLSTPTSVISTSAGNRLLGNWIGFLENGTGFDPKIFYYPNQNGVSITTPGNIIGDGTTAGANVISNNREDGIVLSGAAASTVIAGNVIGLDPTGAIALGNALDGIDIDGVADTLIGGTATGAGNVISSNKEGVVINGAASTGTVLEGNLIGTSPDGESDFGNALDGVWINGSPNNTVGGIAPGAGNVIAGNADGVYISGTASTSNLLQGNFIGTNATGGVNLGNSIDGVWINLGALNNAIGGTSVGAGNTIADNSGYGVEINSGSSNSILGDAIFGNVGSLGNTATVPTPNPAGIRIDAGADNNQPAPVVTSATPEATAVVIQGTLNAASNTTYTIDLFASPFAIASDYHYGQGQTYLGSVTVTTDAAGLATYDANLSATVTDGELITATATDPFGNSSEFSAPIPAVSVQFSLGSATYTATETQGAISIAVTRTGGMGGAASVTFSTSGGTATAGVDYTSVTNTLTFNPGDPATKTFTIPILDPKKLTGSVTVDIALSNPVGASLIAPSTAVLTILDNELPEMALSAPAYNVSQTNSGGTATFTVVRSTDVGVSTVQYHTYDSTAIAGKNYQAVSGTLTFGAGITSQTFTVPLINDNLIHGPLAFVVGLSNATNGIVSSPGAAVVWEIDNATPGTLNLGATSVVANAGQTQVVVPVIRSGGSAGTATVGYTTQAGTATAGSQYTAVSGTLTFAPGVTSENIVVPLLNVTSQTADTNFSIALTPPLTVAALGTVVAASVLIIPPGGTPPDSGGSTGGPAPTVTGTKVITSAAGITGVAFTFSGAMNPARAQNPGSYGYFFLDAGSDADSTPIASVSYNAQTFTATVIPASPIAAGQLDTLILNTPALLAQGAGLTSAGGTRLTPNVAGSTAYESTFVAGSRVSYLDTSGNAVSLKLAGPGTMAVQFNPSGAVSEVDLSGTAEGRSTLTGQVKGARRGKPAVTSIPLITGSAGVKVKIGRPHFLIGGISAEAVDRLASTGRLVARRR